MQVLRKSEKNLKDNVRLNLIFALLWGFSCLITVTVIFAWLYYYRCWISAVVISSALLAFLVIFSIFSPKFRMICILVVPQIGLKHGRSALMALVISTVVAGPIRNMSLNAQNVIQSSTCASQLLINQTDEIFGKAVQPYDLMIEKMKETAKEWNHQSEKSRALLTTVDQYLQSISGTITDVTRAAAMADTAKGAVKSAYNTIRGALTSPFKVTAFTPGNDGLTLQLRNIADKLGSVRDLTRSKLDQLRREVFQSVGIESLHNLYRNLSTDYDRLRNLSEELQKTAEAIKRFSLVAEVVEYLTAFAFLLLYVNCWSYTNKFLRSDKFDNVYVTTRVRELYLKSYTEKILAAKTPGFTKKQMKGLVDITSVMLSSLERTSLVQNLIPPLIYMVIGAVIFGCNMALQWLVGLLIYSSQTGFKFAGTENLTMEASGDGVMSKKLFPTLFKGFYGNREYNISVDLAGCAPILAELPTEDYAIPSALLTTVILLVFCDGYCLRLRQIVLRHLYPERSADRDNYLCQKLRKKASKERKSLFKLRWKAIRKSRSDESRMRDLWFFQSMHSSTFAGTKPMLLSTCAICRVLTIWREKVTCMESGCGAVYCKNCCVKFQLEKNCAICNTISTVNSRFSDL